MKLDSRYLLTTIPESSNIDKDLANRMMSFMRRHKAIGLAANQVGETARLFVMHVDNRPPRRCFNPIILDHSSRVNTKEREGCLSYPKKRAIKPRYLDLIVQYYNQEGNCIEAELNGLEAICFQHELSHLNGENWLQSEPKFDKI